MESSSEIAVHYATLADLDFARQDGHTTAEQAGRKMLIPARRYSLLSGVEGLDLQQYLLPLDLYRKGANTVLLAPQVFSRPQ